MNKADRATAIHEAGHAVISVCFTRRFEYVDVFSRDAANTPIGPLNACGAVVSPTVYQPHSKLDQELMEDSVVIALSGPIAESIYAKKSRAAVYICGGANDCEYVMQALSDFGLQIWFSKFEQRARMFVRQYWPAIETVANELVLRGRLSFAEVVSLTVPERHRREAAA